MPDVFNVALIVATAVVALLLVVALARLARLVAARDDAVRTSAELKARLAKTIDYCKTFKPAQIDGTEDKDITIKLGANERKFTGQGLLQNFILPNFYFHCTTAYDILRHCGVELSKRDFMSTPANL